MQTNKFKLTAKLNESNDHAIKMTELKKLTEEKVTHLNQIIQAAEMNKQLLQQQVQILTNMIEYFKNTTVKSVNKFINRLKLDLNLFTESNLSSELILNSCNST